MAYSLDDIKINGVIGGDETIAIIDGDVYKENQIYKGYRIVEILEKKIVFEKMGQKYIHLVMGGKKVIISESSKEVLKNLRSMSSSSYRPVEYYTALKLWEQGFAKPFNSSTIKLNKNAIKKAHKALPKVNMFDKARLNMAILESRKCIKEAQLKIDISD